MIGIGAGLLSVGAFALWMMNVTKVIPRQWTSKRKEEDPDLWERYLIFYGAIAAAGALMIVVGLVFGL